MKSAANSTTPLSQVLPRRNNEAILVTDSVSCDGRFVLYTIAAEALNCRSSPLRTFADVSNDNNSGVLWISCTSTTDESILNALKRIGCDKAVISSASFVGEHPQFVKPSRISIFSVLNLVEASLIETNVFNEEDFMKGIFRQIKVVLMRLRNSKIDPLCVIIDDTDALAVLVGGRLVYALLISLLSLKSSNIHQFDLVFRSSNDANLDASGISISGKNTTEWLDGVVHNLQCPALSWEQAIMELADSIIDITPLSSGYSREVHGRINVSGRSPETCSASYNYCLTETQVLVMRLSVDRAIAKEYSQS
jgi:hypothetical protein